MYTAVSRSFGLIVIVMEVVDVYVSVGFFVIEAVEAEPVAIIVNVRAKQSLVEVRQRNKIISCQICVFLLL